MRIVVTILIVLLTAGVGSVAFILSSPKYRSFLVPKNTELREQKAFSDLDANQVRTIEVTSPSGVKASFDYDENSNRWNSSIPWQDRAYKKNVEAILNFADKAIIKEVILVNDASPSTLGFDDEAEQITFKNKNGDLLADFMIGLKSPWHSTYQGEEKLFPSLFVRDLTKEADSPTLLCIDPQFQTKALFANDLVRLRDYRPIYSYDLPALTRINLKNKDTTIEMERRRGPKGNRLIEAKADSWKITKPLELRADKAAVIQLIDTLSNITAEEIKPTPSVTLPQNDEDLLQIDLYYHFRKKPVTLKIYPSTTKNNLTLATIGDRQNAVFAIPKLPTKINPRTYSSLPKNVNDVRARNLLELNYKYLDTLVILPKDKPAIRLAKKEHWELVDQNDKRSKINQSSRDDLFNALMKNSIVQFVSDAPTDLSKYGLDQPRLKLALSDKFDSAQILAFGNPVQYENAGVKLVGYYAKSVGQESVWMVSSDVISRIRQHDWEWQPLDITGISITNLKEITRKRTGKPIQYLKYDYNAETLIVREGQDPDPAKNPIITHTIDRNRASYFIIRLCNLKGLRRLNPKSIAAASALKTPCMTLSVFYRDIASGMPKQKVLTIAPAGPLDTSVFFFVKEVNSGDVFTIDRKTYFDLQDSIRYVK